jgi:hypothetical protein
MRADSSERRRERLPELVHIVAESDGGAIHWLGRQPLEVLAMTAARFRTHSDIAPGTHGWTAISRRKSLQTTLHALAREVHGS